MDRFRVSSLLSESTKAQAEDWSDPPIDCDDGCRSVDKGKEWLHDFTEDITYDYKEGKYTYRARATIKYAKWKASQGCVPKTDGVKHWEMAFGELNLSDYFCAPEAKKPRSSRNPDREVGHNENALP